MKTIALIDNHEGGHHLAYLRLYTQTLLNLGCRVITLSREPEQVKNWVNVHCPKSSEWLYTFPIQGTKIPKFPGIGKIPQPLAILERWRQAALAVQGASSKIGWYPDLVFFNWLDSYLSHYLTPLLVDRLFPYPWSGLYFQVGDLRFQPHNLPLINLPLIHYGVANSCRCKALGILDETRLEAMQQHLKTQVIVFPDLTDQVPPDPNYPIVKQIREQAGERKIIGLIGSLSRRKGVLTLLEVAQNSLNQDWFFVLAGQLSESGFSDNELSRLKEVINSPSNNCFFHLERIPDEPQFNALIQSFDILFCAYENYPYSSNILTKAAVFEKPVIVSEGFCMAQRVRGFKLGVTIPEGDVIKCTEAIEYLSDFHPDNYGFKELKQCHSQARISQIFELILS